MTTDPGFHFLTRMISNLRAIITGALIATILICRNRWEKERAKGEPKSDLDGKKKRENPAVLPCPKDPRAVGFRFAPGGCCPGQHAAGTKRTTHFTPYKSNLAQSQRCRRDIQRHSRLFAGANGHATNRGVSLAVANDFGLQGVVEFFAGFQSRCGKQPGGRR